MIFIIGFVILVMIIIFANSGSKKNRTTKNNTTASGVSNIAETVEDDSLTGWIKSFSLCFRIGLFTSIIGGITIAISSSAADSLTGSSIRSGTASTAIQLGISSGLVLLIIAALCFIFSFIRWLFAILFSLELNTNRHSLKFQNGSPRTSGDPFLLSSVCFSRVRNVTG